MLLLLLLVVVVQACAPGHSPANTELIDQPVATQMEQALADLDSLMKSEVVGIDEFVHMVVALPEENSKGITYRDLLDQARKNVERAAQNKDRVAGGLTIWNEDLTFQGQNSDSASFELTFKVRNNLDEAIHDFELMVGTFRENGEEDWASTGGEGYLQGRILEAGEERSGLVFPITLFFGEDDEPDGEYGTYATIRNLREGGAGRVELTTFDLKTREGWLSYPR